jgi:hypothetical protein
MHIETPRQFWNVVLLFAAIWLPIMTYSKFLQTSSKKGFQWKSIQLPFVYFLLTLATYFCLPGSTLRLFCGGISLLFALFLFLRDRFL